MPRSTVLLACLALLAGALVAQAAPLVDPPSEWGAAASGWLPCAQRCGRLEEASANPALPPSPAAAALPPPTSAAAVGACPEGYAKCLIDPCYNGGGCPEGTLCKADCECAPGSALPALPLQ